MKITAHSVYRYGVEKCSHPNCDLGAVYRLTITRTGEEPEDVYACYSHLDYVQKEASR